MKTLIVLILVIVNMTIASASHIGRVIKKQGSAELYFNPSKKVTGNGPHVLFKGLYYNFKKIKLGEKINNGNIIKTNKDSKLKIVYKNGDQFNIGEATSFEIKWKSSSKPPKGNLIYGSIRGIISKTGARSGLLIKSKSAVMGVRGTDFNFTQRGTSGKSAISVIRGRVNVASTQEPNKKMNIEQGFSAELVGDKLATTPLKKLTISRTTKEDLIKIQKDSRIEKQKEDRTNNKAIQADILQLETQAKKATLVDIKEYQPEVYRVIKDKKINSIDAINTTVLTKAYEVAPTKKNKPGFEDMDLKLDEDAYDKYFKVE